MPSLGKVTLTIQLFQSCVIAVIMVSSPLLFVSLSPTAYLLPVKHRSCCMCHIDLDFHKELIIPCPWILFLLFYRHPMKLHDSLSVPNADCRSCFRGTKALHIHSDWMQNIWTTHSGNLCRSRYHCERTLPDRRNFCRSSFSAFISLHKPRLWPIPFFLLPCYNFWKQYSTLEQAIGCCKRLKGK